MELVDRIKYIMKLNQLNVSAFADEIGVQRSSVSHVLSGRNKPSLDFIQKIIKRYPKVDAAWLIDGSTNVIPKQERISSPIVEEIVEQPKKIVENKVREVESQNNSHQNSNKKIKRILVFYEDNTFEEFSS